jgi:hypothetical protein
VPQRTGGAADRCCGRSASFKSRERLDGDRLGDVESLFRCVSTPYGTRPQDGARLQLLQQGLGVLQIGGVEPFGEPVVDFREYRARLVTTIRIAQQPREADG